MGEEEGGGEVVRVGGAGARGVGGGGCKVRWLDYGS